MTSEFKDRLALALEKSGKTKMELARACGVSHPSVTSWLNGKTKDLAFSNALRAANFLGVGLQWLMTGKGAPTANVGAVFEEDGVPEGYIAVPEYRVDFGAGHSDPPTFEEATEAKKAYYRQDFFSTHHINAERCRRFRVHGDSMAPILFDGDCILCDCSPQRIVSGKIYAFCFNNEVRVKRLFTQLNGGILVKSENQNVPDEFIKPEEIDGFYLIGRVIDRSGSGPF